MNDLGPTKEVDRPEDKGCIKRYKTDRLIMAHFKPIKVIGKGSFGEVTKALDTKTGKMRAIKKIKKSSI
jgi:serine/threonine protein kinase